MKKNILFSLICTFLFMAAAVHTYITPSVRISFHAQSDKGAIVFLKYTSAINKKTVTNVLKKSFCPKVSDFVFFDVPVKKLYQMTLDFILIFRQQRIKIDQIKIEGKKTLILPLDNNDIITQESSLLSFPTPLNIEGKTHFSFPAAFVLSLFSFVSFYAVFRFKKACHFAAAIAGYFCFSFYFNTNLAKENAFLTLLLITALYLFYERTSNNNSNRRERAVILIFGILFSFIHLLSYCLTFSLSFAALKYNLLLSTVSATGETFLVYRLCFCLFSFLDYLGQSRQRLANRYIVFFKEHVFGVSFVLIFTVYLLFGLIYYPGRISFDMIVQLEQSLDTANKSQHHPFLSTFLMNGCFKIGTFLKDSAFGLFLYILLQNLVCSAVFGACLKQIKNLKLPDGFLIASLIFFTFFPFGILSVWGVKDVLYSAVFTLFLLQTVTFINTKQTSATFKTAAFYSITGLLVCNLRNNGIYVVLPTLLFLFFRLPYKKILGMIFCFILVTFVLLTRYAYPALGYPAGSKREIFSIPFQQTALYVKQHRSEITTKEYQTIDRVLSFQDLYKNYLPRASDPIKKTYKLEYSDAEFAYLKDYFIVWAKMFFKHPLTYFQALLAQSSHYYAFLPSGSSLPEHIIFLTDWLQAAQAQKETPLSNMIDQFHFTYILFMPFLCFVYNRAFYTNLTILTWIYLLCRKREKSTAPFIPILISVLICIASPVNGLLRYAMPMVAAAPLMIAYAVSDQNRKTDNEH